MVSQKEITEELRGECNGCKRDMLADRIEAEGIAPPDGHIIVPTCAVRKKPYVPMTDDERNEMMAVWHENADLPPMIQYIEATVIKRAGLEVKHD